MNMSSSAPLPEISLNGAKYNTLPTDIFKRLLQAGTEEQILQAGVEIVHQALNCDRAVVYSMQSISMYKITAEAVTPGYSQILHSTIEDPCFEARYFDKYQKGRVKAITDIYEAGMNPCYVENLAKIDVKANLIVPLIAVDDSLDGLLVMHQCSRTRQWQQTEIEFVLSMANWLMKQVSQQKAHSDLVARLESEKQIQQQIVNIAREIHGKATIDGVLQVAVEKTKEILNCDRVVVYGLQDSSMGEIVAEATAPALAPILANVIKDPCFEYGYIDKYQQGRIRAIANIHEASMSPCYVENLAKIGVKANLVAPINCDNGRIYGLLVAHQCFSVRDWQPGEIEYIKQIAFHTGLSLSKAELKQESTLVETGLSELNKIREAIDRARTKIEQIQTPIQNTNQITIEINNLNKLLEREINQLNQDSSLQTRKNTKLIQIIVKKLAVVTAKLHQSLVQVNTSSNEAQITLDRAMDNFDS